MRNPRLNIDEAIRLAQAKGIRVKRKWDGHVLFYLEGNRTVSVNPGRKDVIVPPHLMKALRT